MIKRILVAVALVSSFCVLGCNKEKKAGLSGEAPTVKGSRPVVNHAPDPAPTAAAEPAAAEPAAAAPADGE